MNGTYDDIIHLPHHVSTRHAPMSMIDRAAQFSPFAALTGYDAAIKETARLTDQQHQLDEDGIKLLDEKIQLVNELISQQPTVSVEYFRPDCRKSGGAYVETTAKAVKIDHLHQSIILDNGTVIHFNQIRKFDSDIFRNL